MNLRRIKHTLLRLSAEEKIIGVGSLLIIVGAFMPWHSIVMSFDKKSITQTGFGGDLGVIGFVIFIMAILTLLSLVGDHMHIKLPQFGYSKEQVLFFLMGQNAFLVLLTIAIYTKRSLDFTEAELRFGIYLALIGAFLGAFAAFAQIQKTKKKEVQEFFGQEDEEIDEEEFVTPEETPKEEITQELFEEAHAESVPQGTDEYIPEDDMIEEVKEIPKKEPATQADYFTREAGVEAEEEMEPETKEEPEMNNKEPEEKKEGGSALSMNFYED